MSGSREREGMMEKRKWWAEFGFRSFEKREMMELQEEREGLKPGRVEAREEKSLRARSARLD